MLVAGYFVGCCFFAAVERIVPVDSIVKQPFLDAVIGASVFYAISGSFITGVLI